MKKILTITLIILLLSIVVQAQSKKQDKSLEQLAKEKANEMANQVEQRIQNMTFEEFEAFANSSPYAGQFTRAELKKDYNKMHQNDGKAVKIYPEDYEQPELMKKLKAMDAMETAQTYEEFRKYLKIANPDLKEEDIRKLWEAELNKRQQRRNNSRVSNPSNNNKQRKNKKDTTRMAIDNSHSGRNTNNGDNFGLGDLFGGDNNSGNNGGGSIDLGGILDVMESDEAAELGKRAEEIDIDQIEAEANSLDAMMPTSRVEFLKMSGLTDRQARATDAYLEANDDSTASVTEREQRGGEYFRAMGTTDERWVDFGVAMTVNRDPQKIKRHKYGKDKDRKKDYEDEIDKGSYKRKEDAIKEDESVEDYLKRMDAEKDEWLRYEDDHSMTLTEMARYGFPRGKLIIIMGQRSWDGYYKDFTVNQVYEEFFPIFPDWRQQDFVEFQKQLKKYGGDVEMALDGMEFKYD